jgi:hypothetical protein
VNLLATLGQQYEITAGVGIAEPKTITFNGDVNGLVGNVRLFDVTGMVGVKIYARCAEDVRSSSGTIEVGTSTSTAGLIGQATASNLVANEIWHDATPDQTLELATVSTEKLITSDIILTVATDYVSGGKIDFVCIWRPLSVGANLVAAADNSSASPSLSPSASTSKSGSLSRSPSASASRSLSPSSSVSPSASESRSLSPSSSVSPSSSASASASRSLSPSASTSISPSASESRSVSPSASASRSLSPSASESRSVSPSSSTSPSSSASASLSPSSSKSPSASPSRSLSPSSSTSPSASVSPSASGL